MLYLAAVLTAGVLLLTTGGGAGGRPLLGVAALVLWGGDACHLLPRVWFLWRGGLGGARAAAALGAGKLIASLTMTAFYLLLWQAALLRGAVAPAGATEAVYTLALSRALLCLLPQNRWADRQPPPRWALWRNAPFVLLGLAVGLLLAMGLPPEDPLRGLWPAIMASFACYLPVILFAGRRPALGVLMLPKSCAYVAMLIAALRA
ncbi:MAG: hypothetical protein LBF64_03085 [Oscillospiraceae bacterium]|nr:hypothetical protein [Oscillospiraceae bacterium]